MAARAIRATRRLELLHSSSGHRPRRTIVYTLTRHRLEANDHDNNSPSSMTARRIPTEPPPPPPREDEGFFCSSGAEPETRNLFPLSFTHGPSPSGDPRFDPFALPQQNFTYAKHFFKARSFVEYSSTRNSRRPSVPRKRIIQAPNRLTDGFRM